MLHIHKNCSPKIESESHLQQLWHKPNQAIALFLHVNLIELTFVSLHTNFYIWLKIPITHLGGNADAVRQLGAGQAQIRGRASDDDFGVGIQRTGSQDFAQIGDAGLVTVQLPVASDTELATHFVRVD